MSHRIPIEEQPCPENHAADRHHLWGREEGRKCTLCGAWRPGNRPQSRKPTRLTVVSPTDPSYDATLKGMHRRSREMYGTPDPQDPVAYLEGTADDEN